MHYTVELITRLLITLLGNPYLFLIRVVSNIFSQLLLLFFRLQNCPLTRCRRLIFFTVSRRFNVPWTVQRKCGSNKDSRHYSTVVYGASNKLTIYFVMLLIKRRLCDHNALYAYRHCGFVFGYVTEMRYAVFRKLATTIANKSEKDFLKIVRQEAGVVNLFASKFASSHQSYMSNGDASTSH